MVWLDRSFDSAALRSGLLRKNWHDDRDRQRQDDRTDHIERVAKSVTQKIGQKLRDGMKVKRFPARSRLREPLSIARAACFERMAGVFAIRAASANTTAT